MVPALSLRVQWLGERLRKGRKAAGYTLDEAADFLQLSANTLSRFERGTMRVRRSYIRDLIDFYGIGKQRERDALFQLSEDAWRRDWWTGDVADLDMEFIDYTWLEARASHIYVYDPMLINGLLQTERYARAIMSYDGEPELAADYVARMVELRMTRQKILEGEEPTRLSLIIEEAPIRRLTGGSAVMKEQLMHLLHAAKRDHIAIRVLPAEVGWHPGVKGPFTCFDMPDPYPDVAYIETFLERNFLEDSTKVNQYFDAYKELGRLALTPAKSDRFIRAALKEFE